MNQNYIQDSIYRTVNNVCVIKTGLLMMCTEIIADWSEILAQHIQVICGLDVEFANVEHGGTKSNR
jgi:hypothetical protein